jgi:hypothetical protein
MLDEESKGRVRSICNQIAREKNPERFSTLVQELNQIFDSADLDGTEKRDSDKVSRTGK